MRAVRVVLVNPQIPHNTGAIGRTCLGLNAELHLIKPLGFTLDSAAVKRAGLDYWPKLNAKSWDSWGAFEKSKLNTERTRSSTYLFSREGRYGSVSLFDVSFPSEEDCTVTLVFGSEHSGIRDLPEKARQLYRKVYLPMDSSMIRSYNLANSASVGLFELRRQWHVATQKD